MTNLRSHERDLIASDEKALRKAGFSWKTSHALALLNSWAFPAAIVVSVVSLSWIGFHLWPDLDVARWQAWADENPEFFAPLDTGDTVAVLPDLHSHFGLVLTRRPAGVQVERHLWFPFDDVPVALVVAPEAADRWLRLDYDDGEFWSKWHSLATDPGIQIYLHLDRDSASALGYDEFLARLRPSPLR